MNIRLFTVCLSAAIWLTACGDNAPSSTTPTITPTRLTGHVSNDDGPVGHARIEAKDAHGQVAANAELQGGSNTYQLSLPAGTAYPVILTAYPQATPAPLKAAVSSPLAAEQDISPITTIIVDTALSLGGLTEANLAKAAGAAIALRKKSGGSGGGATTESFKGDPTTQHGGWH